LNNLNLQKGNSICNENGRKSMKSRICSMNGEGGGFSVGSLWIFVDGGLLMVDGGWLMVDG
jgi:hypothetical protein